MNIYQNSVHQDSVHQDKMATLERLMSSGHNYCEGYYASSHPGYFLGVNLGVAAVKQQFSHPGSSNLDRINAFDMAEIASANISQINMIQVSSFCGPKGVIWGYDVCVAPKKLSPYKLQGREFEGVAGGLDELRVWDIDPLIDAFARLTGRAHEPRFPFMPGSHVPCAVKYITASGSTRLYAAQALGIPDDRSRHACLIMEDFGKLMDSEREFRDVLVHLVGSVLAIGQNQRVNYKDIFVGIRAIDVGEGEMGCALVANPYFVLARRAFPSGNEPLSSLTLRQWEMAVAKDFAGSDVFC